MASSYIPDGSQEALLTLMTLVYPCPLPKGRKLAASGCSFTKVNYWKRARGRGLLVLW
jgi:hypothetical protein